MISLRNQHALITGASSGIGRAIALHLAREGTSCLLVGRNPETLAATLEEVNSASTDQRNQTLIADLSTDDGADSVVSHCVQQGTALNMIVHSAASICDASASVFSDSELDTLLSVNLRAPMRITRGLLPIMVDHEAQIVFINSSITRQKRSRFGLYGVTKDALDSFCDRLREEVNGRGIRVLSVHPGRTATPLQHRVHEWEKREYRPTQLLQVDDIASMVVHGMRLPKTAEVTKIWIRPMTPLEST
ncbi:SDR family oxidoreductase [Petrachloros mirabilis]